MTEESTGIQSRDEDVRRVRRQWLVQVACGLGVLTVSIDTGAVNISVYTLAQHFQVDAATAAWLPLIAFLTVTSTLLLFGRLSDLLGSKLIYTGGFVVYALGLLAAGLAPNFALLLAFRGLQALGISMISANNAAILTQNIPPHQRGMALGINSTCVGAGFLIGPIIAGNIITLAGWRYVFFAIIPLSLIALLLALSILPRGALTKGGRFDFLGALLFAVAVVSLLLAINFARSSSLGSPLALGLFVAAGLAIAAFITVERRVSEPILDLGLFRVRLFSLSIASAVALFLGTTGQDLLVALFVQQVMLLDPSQAGYIVATVPLVRALNGSLAGFISDRLGSRWPSGLGCVSICIGIFGLSRMDAGATVPYLVACLVLIGMGTGFFLAPNMHAIMAAVPPDKLGVGAGMIGMRRNLGQSMSLALAAYLLQIGSGGSGAAVPGFQLAFSVEAAFVAAAAVMAFASGSTGRARRAAPSRRVAIRRP